MSSKILVTLGLLIVMIGLGTADALYVEKSLPFSLASTTGTGSDTGTHTGQPVRKSEGPDVLQTFTNQQLNFEDTNEVSILGRVVPPGKDTVNSKVLLKDSDRASFVAWVDSSEVKNYFLSLKEALHTSFTPAVTDLLDEAQQREGLPTRNILTFKDTGLFPERVVFVRVRERLYEFHIAEGKDDLIFALIEDLTK